MSGYFSSKYVKYREVAKGGPIQKDLACPRCKYNLRGLNWGGKCPECGDVIEPSPGYFKRDSAAEGGTIDWDLTCRFCTYNLRGLTYGRRCPECGNVIQFTPGENDLLTAGDAAERSRWSLGFSLTLICLIGILGLRMFYFIASAVYIGQGVAKTYITISATAWVFLALAAWVLTGPALDPMGRACRGLRWACRLLFVLSIPAAFCLVSWVFDPATPGKDDGRFQVGFLLRIGSAVGLLLLVYLLQRIADEAGLEQSGRRLNLALWFLAPSSVLLTIVPVQIGWTSLILLAPILILFMLIFGFWIWAMLMVILPLWAMLQHLRWIRIMSVMATGRGERIDATRRDLAEELDATIRVTPEPKGELKLGESTGGSILKGD